MPIVDILHPLLKRYRGAPARLQTPAGRAYAALHPGLRPGRVHDEFHDETVVWESAAWGRATAGMNAAPPPRTS